MERELWKIISRIVSRLDRRVRRGRCVHSSGRIVRVWMWAALRDRPVYWACDRRNWAGVKPPPCLPDQSTMSRRLRDPRTRDMLNAVHHELSRRLQSHPHAGQLIKYLDGKPLTVARHSVDPCAEFGGVNGRDRGYKIHAIYGETDLPLAYSVTPLNLDEPTVARDQLLPQLDHAGYLLADANYDNNALHDAAAKHDQLLVTPRRYKKARGVGHHRHSPHRLRMLARMAAPSPFLRTLLAQRRRVETRFANLTNFGGGLTHLPPWVRGPRVELWVQAKFIIRAARTYNMRGTAA